jgi:hypothetical protein
MAIYLDTETTGLSPRQGATIVELAIVDDRGKALIDTLVNPRVDIPWQATKVHGITNEMVRRRPTLRELMPQIREIIKGEEYQVYDLESATMEQTLAWLSRDDELLALKLKSIEGVEGIPESMTAEDKLEFVRFLYEIDGFGQWKNDYILGSKKKSGEVVSGE